MAETESFVNRLRLRLRQEGQSGTAITTPPSPERMIPAAVLIAMFLRDGEPYFLFTRRTHLVEHHKGDISFPGGAHQEEDANLLDTALREAEEEIGLHPQDVEVLGELAGHFTSQHFVVRPFIGLFPYPYKFELHPIEVAELIEVPLSHLQDKRNLHPMAYPHGLTAYCFHYQGHVIWGLTYRILTSLLELMA